MTEEEAEKVGNMFSKTHQGIVKKTVVLEFENGYQITLNAGIEISMHLVMDEMQIKAAGQKMHPTPPTSRTEIANAMASAILAKREARKSAGR